MDDDPEDYEDDGQAEQEDEEIVEDEEEVRINGYMFRFLAVLHVHRSQTPQTFVYHAYLLSGGTSSSRC